jgi:8-amino-7-oxononanoate synthase
MRDRAANNTGGTALESLERFAADKLASLAARGLKRELSETLRSRDAIALRGLERLVSFSCNDYLNLATHPQIIAAAVAAAKRFGVGAAASRAVTGNHPLYAALESRLAALKGTTGAVVFGSGYLVNSGVIPALMGPGDVIFPDRLSHACAYAGCTLSGARIVPYEHNDMASLAALLHQERRHHRHAMIWTETVFSMDGDRAPLGDIVRLAQAHDAWAMTDDAHGLGVVVPHEQAKAVPLQMGTLSKAAGGYGGYLCATAEVVALIRNRARSFVYTTGLPPATVAAATAALDFMQANPEYCALPLAKARRFTAAAGLPAAESAIVPVIIGDSAAALAQSRRLADAGFLVAAIRPPTVPEGTARLRIAFSAAHRDEDVDRLAELVRGPRG